jgi:hypothetical protein
MNFTYLSKTLVPTAERAVLFFKESHGISGFKVEEGILPTLPYRPTLQAATPDHHILCVEVSESPYPPVLESSVLDAITQTIPIKLYVAFPSDPLPPDYKTRVDRARSHGVGVIEVTLHETKVIHPPISLSLVGLRRVERNEFPAKYRSPLAEAETTFRGGSPSAGCLLVYSEIESLSRRIAKKTKARGMWRALRPGEKAPKVNFDKGAWAKVMDVLIDHLDPTKCPTPDHALLSRVAGLTAPRNDSGHKPGNRAALIRRDRALRTRFEHAVDILSELIEGSRHLRV